SHFGHSVCMLILMMVFQSFDSVGQVGRVKTSLNHGWQFSRTIASDSLEWEAVNLPHTWNAQDVMDDKPGYHRAVCSYRKELQIDSRWKGKNLFIYFEGANQVADLLVNGKKVGSHTGGYTGFIVRVDQFLNFEEGARNEIVGYVDDRHNENIPPLWADFTFFISIYQDGFLLATD